MVIPMNPNCIPNFGYGSKPCTPVNCKIAWIFGCSTQHIQGGASKLFLLVYNPLKTVDISPTKTIAIGVINQLSYLGGTTIYIYIHTYIWYYKFRIGRQNGEYTQFMAVSVMGKLIITGSWRALDPYTIHRSNINQENMGRSWDEINI